jgi:uncharacterized Tic20 family protein
MCRLFNEPSAERCDCGYSFLEKSMPMEPKEVALGEEGAWLKVIHCLGLLNFFSLFVTVIAIGGAWLLLRKKFESVRVSGAAALNFWVTLGLALLGVTGMSVFFASSELGRQLLTTNGKAILALVSATIFSIKLIGVLYSLIGAVNAVQGKPFRYPGGIPFLRTW